MNNEIKISKVEKIGDVEKVLNIWQESGAKFNLKQSEKHFCQSLAEGYNLYKAEVDGDVVGVVGLRLCHDICEDNTYYIMNNFAVSKKARGMGVGSKLISFVKDKLKKGEYVFLLCGNEKAYGLYEKHGFNMSGSRVFIFEK